MKLADDEALKKLVFETLHEPPSLHGFNRTSWKMTDLRDAIKAKGSDVGLAVIHDIVHAAGYRWRKAPEVLTSNDPAYREKLAELQNVLCNLTEVERFFSVDEFGPFAIKIKGGQMLVPHDSSYTVPQWQKSKGWLILTAGLELSRNQVTHFYSTAKNTTEMIRMANALLAEYHDCERIFLSWDAASWHLSKKLHAFVDDHNCTCERAGLPLIGLVPLPVGAQFLNVIESVFSGMVRAIIHNSSYQSVDEAKGAIDRYFTERNRHFTEHPQRAGKNIWRREKTDSEFDQANNCKDKCYR